MTWRLTPVSRTWASAQWMYVTVPGKTLFNRVYWRTTTSCHVPVRDWIQGFGSCSTKRISASDRITGVLLHDKSPGHTVVVLGWCSISDSAVATWNPCSTWPYSPRSVLGKAVRMLDEWTTQWDHITAGEPQARRWKCLKNELHNENVQETWHMQHKVRDKQTDNGETHMTHDLLSTAPYVLHNVLSTTKCRPEPSPSCECESGWTNRCAYHQCRQPSLQWCCAPPGFKNKFGKQQQ